MIVKRVIANGASEDGLDNGYDGADSSGDHGQSEPPPSYEASSTPHTSVSEIDVKSKALASDTSLGKSPAQVSFDDLIAGSSTRAAHRGLPLVPANMVSPTREEQKPEPSQDNPQPPVLLHDPSQQPRSSPPVRPQLPHAPQSTPDPRGRAKLEHIQERDPFGNSFNDEGPFAAARRAQLVDNGPKIEPDSRTYANGRMPSFKPGEIIPVNTMRPATGAPPFFPPHQAPPFPPIAHHAPIRPAHFPPELHPTPSPQPTRMPSQRHSPPAQAPQPIRSQSIRQPPSAPPLPHPQMSPQPSPQPSRAPSQRQAQPPSPPQPTGPYSHGHPIPTPSPPQPPHMSMPPQMRRHTYDARGGIPPGLAPNGRYAGPHPGVPQPYPASPPQGYPQQPPPQGYSQPLPQKYSQPSPQGYPQPPPQGYPHTPPQGHPQPYPQAYPPGHPSGAVTHPPYQTAQPGRSILRQPQRHSVQTPPSHQQIAAPGPTPVRLPSQNVPPPSPHALGIVHAPPTPSGSPRPDPNRAPRSTPKPVMPQLLATQQDNTYGRTVSPQLQRSASAIQPDKGGLLSKTRSILRKRTSASGIKTHADGAITFAPQPQSSKRYENRVPALGSVREDSGGGAVGKLSKRLSKKK